MSRILVRVVETIVVIVAEVCPRYAVSVVTCEEIAEASSLLGFAIVGRLIGSVTTIVVAIAMPVGGDASGNKCHSVRYLSSSLNRL